MLARYNTAVSREWESGTVRFEHEKTPAEATMDYARDLWLNDELSFEEYQEFLRTHMTEYEALGIHVDLECPPGSMVMTPLQDKQGNRLYKHLVTERWYVHKEVKTFLGFGRERRWVQLPDIDQATLDNIVPSVRDLGKS